MKKWIVITVSVWMSIIFSFVSVSAETNNTNTQSIQQEPTAVFTDLDGVWQEAKQSIQTLYERKIIKGFGDGTFRPNGKVTREQFVKLLLKSRGIQVDSIKKTGQTIVFSDVPVDRWSYPYIEAAVEKGIILPREYGSTYHPETNISRQEMAVLAARILKLKKDEAALTFKDNNTILNNRGLVGANAKAGIITGYQDGTFRPQETATRAQVAVIITRVMKYK